MPYGQSIPVIQYPSLILSKEDGSVLRKVSERPYRTDVYFFV